MFKITKPLFFICETPLHAGSGSDLGVVDLPIQREKHTSFPKIEASSLKGAIRESFESQLDGREKNKYVEALFGPEDAGNDAHMGALAFSDARLLLFPVKSVKGVFAWITCPKVLQQFERDMRLTNPFFKMGDLPSIAEGTCYVFSEENTLKINNQYISLEEYTFEVESRVLDVKVKETEGDSNAIRINEWLTNNASKEAFFKDKMSKDVVLLSNDDFKDFVNLSTEVITRTKIDNETGTVVGGALFTEEFLPAESVLYSLVMAAPIFKTKETKQEKAYGFTAEKEEEGVMNKFTEVLSNKLRNVLQIGGNATLGKGIVRTNIV